MKFLAGAALSAYFIFPAVAGAQTAQPPAGAQAQAGATAAAATPTVGATVYDSTGAVLGTVDQVTPQAIVVDVAGTKVGLPPASVGAGPNGLRVATTRADVEAQAKQAQAGQQAQLVAQLAPGTSVRGAAGATVGTVKSTDAQFVTLTTPKGDVRLPIAGFAMGPNGPSISLTAAQLDAAMTQAGAAEAPTDAGTTTDTAGGADAASTTTGAAASATATKQVQKRTTTTTRRTRRTDR